ncbi:hypothetical protein CLV78_1112 [Aliiruegeria haliotis]|uniref:Uncharacterized protein n=1 Tax=Aliiruegeria haliotis TaxID=1280846 RepID=A0A2T0RI71_9RHOB|nr:hypothetical protein [Aliiruegeria haliotis]PRY20849.1 hypothetical protein CLV78_1112 [Aliiruegeria haliotis]
MASRLIHHERLIRLYLSEDRYEVEVHGHGSASLEHVLTNGWVFEGAGRDADKHWLHEQEMLTLIKWVETDPKIVVAVPIRSDWKDRARQKDGIHES